MPTAGKKKTTSTLSEHAIERLLRGSGDELDAFFSEVKTDSAVLGTKAKVHCYIVSHDGNDQPRVDDLALEVAIRMIDYAIPRSEILRAQESDRKNNSTVETSRLKAKARGLFSNLSKTGEGGEMLLYMLVQNYLRIPQLLCKMPLKTSNEVHYHGADGIHVTFDKQTKKLALYWGESKLYQNVETAITNCLDSIKPFLCDTGGSSARQNRDLQLISTNLDLCDEDLEDAFLTYLDPKNPNFNKLQYRGVCLIGFDDKSYPTAPNTKTEQDVINEVDTALVKWHSSLNKKIRAKNPLELFVMEVFLIPFPSVKKFRASFLGELKNV